MLTREQETRIEALSLLHHGTELILIERPESLTVITPTAEIEFDEDGEPLALRQRGDVR